MNTPKPLIVERPDFTVQNEGSLYLFKPLTDSARHFLDEITTHQNYHLRFGDAFAVEHRFAADFAANLKDEGFNL